MGKQYAHNVEWYKVLEGFKQESTRPQGALSVEMISNAANRKLTANADKQEWD